MEAQKYARTLLIGGLIILIVGIIYLFTNQPVDYNKLEIGSITDAVGSILGNADILSENELRKENRNLAITIIVAGSILSIVGFVLLKSGKKDEKT